MNSKNQRRYKLDVWAERNAENMLAQIKAYIVTKYGDFAYDSRPARKAVWAFFQLIEEECCLYKYGQKMLFEEDGVRTIRREKIMLGECFHFMSPYYLEEFESKPYLDFLCEMEWVTRARYLSDEQCEDPDYAVNKGEKYYYFYGINHEQLDANFGDKLAVEKKYDVLKFDKVALAFWN